jgi:hypothetical protein
LRMGPFVFGPISARRSKASSMTWASSADI